MYTIVICDDEKKYRDIIENNIKKVILIEDLDAKIHYVAKSVEEVEENIKQYGYADLYIFDIELSPKGKTGLELASKIRDSSIDTSIVFITSYEAYMPLTFKYQIGALDYIRKTEEDLEKRIREMFINVYKHYQKKSEAHLIPRLRVKIGDRMEYINYEDIMYIESYSEKHKVIFHLSNRIFETTGTLKDFDNIDDIFCRCHASYIVNKNNILRINKKESKVVFKNDAFCYASRRGMRQLVK